MKIIDDYYKEISKKAEIEPEKVKDIFDKYATVENNLIISCKNIEEIIITHKEKADQFLREYIEEQNKTLFEMLKVASKMANAGD